jgi:putative ABC transport system substrate-binding protein
MRRRHFIGLIGSTLAAWPLVARAQQLTKEVPVVGFLRSSRLADSTHLVAALRHGLKEAGFVEGQNFTIEFRWAEGQSDRLPALVRDLISRQTAVLVGETVAAHAAKAATSAVPFVFATGSDPVRDGLVASLNRPGGNITGIVFFNSQVGSKRLELLRQVAPKAAAIGVLVNPNNPHTEGERKDVQTAAHAVGQQLIVLDVSSGRDIEQAFATFAQRGAGALLVGSGAFLNSNRERLVALAAHHRLPTINAQREAVVAGGLMSYGASITDAYRQVGIYAGRILKGEKPADLPVMRSTKFEFVLNLKTAKALGLEVPDRILALADEVIE